MNTVAKGSLLALVFLLASSGLPAYADVIEGIVSDVSLVRKTFRISPGSAEGAKNQAYLFIVRPDTEFSAGFNFRELDAGSRILVEGKQVNPFVWKATNIIRQ